MNFWILSSRLARTRRDLANDSEKKPKNLRKFAKKIRLKNREIRTNRIKLLLFTFENRRKIKEKSALFGGPYRNSHRQFFYCPWLHRVRLTRSFTSHFFSFFFAASLVISWCKGMNSGVFTLRFCRLWCEGFAPHPASYRIPIPRCVPLHHGEETAVSWAVARSLALSYIMINDQA